MTEKKILGDANTDLMCLRDFLINNDLHGSNWEERLDNWEGSLSDSIVGQFL